MRWWLIAATFLNLFSTIYVMWAIHKTARLREAIIEKRREMYSADAHGDRHYVCYAYVLEQDIVKVASYWMMPVLLSNLSFVCLVNYLLT